MSSFLLGMVVLRYNFEYIAYTYLVIYFGAILTLFVFVTMLLDIERVYEREFYISINVSVLCAVLIKVIYLIRLFYTDYLRNYVGVFNEFVATINESEARFSTHDSTFQMFLLLFNFYGFWLV